MRGPTSGNLKVSMMLRIPMRGYEEITAMGERFDVAVTNPHEGL